MSNYKNVHLNSGVSSEDSICFNSTFCKSKATIINKNEPYDLKTTLIADIKNKKLNKEEKKDLFVQKVLIILGILTYGILLVLYIMNVKPILFACYSFITLFELSIILRQSTNNMLRMNHAAEHMSINAFNTLRQIPTEKEIKTFSKFSLNCSCKYEGAFLFFCILNIILNMKLPVIALTIIFCKLPIFKFIGYLSYPIQYLVTKEPKHENLELAHLALANCIRVSNAPYEVMELAKNINKDYSSYNNFVNKIKNDL